MGSLLRPVDLVNQPLGFQERYKILQKLFKQLQKAYAHTKGTDIDLERLATRLEVHVAKNSLSGQSYKFNMSILLRDVLKYKGDLSKIKINGRPLKGAKPHLSSIGNANSITTKSKAMEALKALILDSKVLEKNGYIVKEMQNKTNDDNSTQLYAPCLRCSTNFKKTDIMEKTLCRYHPLKRIYNRDAKNHQYPCCGETTDSVSFLRLGCKTFFHHVFRGESYDELCKISKFSSTDDIDGVENVLSLDCEMAFTSLGYEMIRLTIVDFFTGKTLFDHVIQPIGDIVDLNSDFSGVHEIDRTNCPTYKEALDVFLSENLINKNSILIGHGLENDLNVMRLFHNKVIDTAILYSKTKFKVSLKNLAFEVLSRKIQNGEHDSSQDAIATMDVVKVKIGISPSQNKWEK
ncbi:CEI_1a_G0035460.mRNA.1.CDS.1 [Saccharomyces cerevisiae]|nr:EM14S01-3B_G0037310.mRNA.1.CDS.1 [Saccharomyces cerevisiae]CAI4673080.1 AMH_1a_G0035610.mRNA.1.CDS.1 [Saccharomyces cerevisiae]CAI4677436.1 CEI_1a_G0035460.mRNA.1.CDS.1 [Saccharomyces cerevisiae]CAI6829838.1 AMH_1a_G0035610.mRNA.1.CDS.1 [Saccharomyces cerevisiae]CAI7421532.1 CEI_1a_G0035460.mRNA.1.CDS.1 [Saccharomyces cerevisiae]